MNGLAIDGLRHYDNGIGWVDAGSLVVKDALLKILADMVADIGVDYTASAGRHHKLYAWGALYLLAACSKPIGRRSGESTTSESRAPRLIHMVITRRADSRMKRTVGAMNDNTALSPTVAGAARLLQIWAYESELQAL